MDKKKAVYSCCVLALSCFSMRVLGEQPAPPETIAYDDGKLLNIDLSENTLFAVRFTPTSPFNLTAVSVMFLNDRNTTDGANVWVAENKGGVPVWPAISVGQIPKPLPDSVWIRYDLAGSIYFESDFFIIVQQKGSLFYPAYPAPSFWVGIDSGTTTRRTIKAYDGGQTWVTEGRGDALIRGNIGPAILDHPLTKQLDARLIRVEGLARHVQLAEAGFDRHPGDVGPEVESALVDDTANLCNGVVNVGRASRKAVPRLRVSEIRLEIGKVLGQRDSLRCVLAVDQAKLDKPAQCRFRQAPQPRINLSVGPLAVAGGNHKLLDHGAEPLGVPSGAAAVGGNPPADAPVILEVDVPFLRLAHVAALAVFEFALEHSHDATSKKAGPPGGTHQRARMPRSAPASRYGVF